MLLARLGGEIDLDALAAFVHLSDKGTQRREGVGEERVVDVRVELVALGWGESAGRHVSMHEGMREGMREGIREGIRDGGRRSGSCALAC